MSVRRYLPGHSIRLAASYALARADDHESEDPIEHARDLKKSFVPMMDSLREAADELETLVAADLWTLPSYRELLFIK